MLVHIIMYITEYCMLVQKQAVEGNVPHEGHWWVYEGGRACVGVRHGMVEVKLLCFRWQSTFLKLV
jgi:hypothetical protein